MPILVLRSRRRRSPLLAVVLVVSSLAFGSLLALPLSLLSFGFLRLIGEQGPAMMTKVGAIYLLNLLIGCSYALLGELRGNRTMLILYRNRLVSAVRRTSANAATPGCCEVAYRQIRHLARVDGSVRVQFESATVSGHRGTELAVGSAAADVFDLLVARLHEIPGHRFSHQEEQSLAVSVPWQFGDLFPWQQQTRVVTCRWQGSGRMQCRTDHAKFQVVCTEDRVAAPRLALSRLVEVAAATDLQRETLFEIRDSQIVHANGMVMGSVEPGRPGEPQIRFLSGDLVTWSKDRGVEANGELWGKILVAAAAEPTWQLRFAQPQPEVLAITALLCAVAAPWRQWPLERQE